MSNFILKKDHLPSFLRQLSKGDRRLVAPVKNSYGDTLFTQITSLDAVDLDLENQPQNSLKAFFFPQQQVLFTYTKKPDVDKDADKDVDKTSEQYNFETVHRLQPTLFFGVRSCDLSAILYMDVIFFKNYKDPYYQEMRRDNIIISMGCNEPFPNCFCRQTKSGPFLEYGYDLQLTDLGDRFFVEVGRSQGKEIVAQYGLFFSQASRVDEKAQYQARLEVLGKFKQQVLVNLAIKRLKEGLVSDVVFRKLSSRCQDCGGCAYICPTCTCFTITDRRLSEESGERLRSWDACTFAGFTNMAGDHNPIDMKHERIKRRFLHKLYYDVKAHNRPSCVGCGRCVDMCFGGVDIIKFIKMVCESE